MIDLLDSLGTAFTLFAVALLIFTYVLLPKFFDRERAAKRQASKEIEAGARLRIAQRLGEELVVECQDALDEVRGYFPFVEEPSYLFGLDLDPAGDLDRWISQSYTLFARSVPNKLPVPIPPDGVRRRHLYTVGKTGTGKSTFLEHLILNNIADGRGVAVIGPEGEFFRKRLLPLVPKERLADVVYFAPADPENPYCLNPLALEDGDDPARAAEDLYTIFKRCLGDVGLGTRMQPILQNAFAALVGREDMTLWDVRRMLEDVEYREQVALSITDPYVRSFWFDTYQQFPKGAATPLVTRLDRFLRPTALRRCLGAQQSNLSIRQVLAENKILFVDLFGLSEDARLLLGQLIVAKFQLELMRRELGGRDTAPSHYLYADEFQSIAGVAVATWRELLSRGRKYGLCLTLAHQFPAQLPGELRDEILGNVSSVVSFAQGSKDAAVMRKEFLVERKGKGATPEPIPASALNELPVGGAYVKLGGGRALKVQVFRPKEVSEEADSQALIEKLWAGVPKAQPIEAPEVAEVAPVLGPDAFLE